MRQEATRTELVRRTFALRVLGSSRTLPGYRPLETHRTFNGVQQSNPLSSQDGPTSLVPLHSPQDGEEMTNTLGNL